jgi:uncharacterized protein (TIGR02391 family)
MATSTAKTSIPAFSSQQIEGITQALGHTSDGLKGSEIGHLLRECQMPDPTPADTKWRRLFNAFAEDQNRSQIGTHIMQFIVKAMNPARYTTEPDPHRIRLNGLNSVLAFTGYQITERGKVRSTEAAGTVNEALERTDRLHAALKQRNVHQDVLRFCTSEIIQQNYFHAVFEAKKSITAKIRGLSGLSKDGAELVHEAFGQKFGPPLLAINPLLTETQRGEQNGFVSLLKGLYGTIRNPLAHDPKVEWDMTEQDALDILTTISLVHRKLDQVCRNRPC